MFLFRSEMLPFHPPRYASRIGEGLARYGRPRARRHGCAPGADADDAPAHDGIARAGDPAERASRAPATATADAVVSLAA